MEIAQWNLEELPFQLLKCEGAGVYYARTGDGYDASRLLLKDQIRSLPLDGAPVAIAVNENCLLIAGDDDVDGLRMMAKYAETISAEPRPLCPIPLRLVRGEWESWLPPEDHELYATYHQLEMQYLFEKY